MIVASPSLALDSWEQASGIDLKQGDLCREVRGVARRTVTVLEAFFAKTVDLATNDPHTGVLGADIVILATPVRTIVWDVRRDRATSSARNCRDGYGQ